MRNNLDQFISFHWATELFIKRHAYRQKELIEDICRLFDRRKFASLIGSYLKMNCNFFVIKIKIQEIQNKKPKTDQEWL